MPTLRLYCKETLKEVPPSYCDDIPSSTS